MTVEQLLVCWREQLAACAFDMSAELRGSGQFVIGKVSPMA